MKQHITAQQLDELSIKGREKLAIWYRDWQNKHHIHIQGLVQEYRLDGSFKIRLPSLSIGQMIEFLEEHVPTLEIRGRRMTKSLLRNVPDNTIIWDIEGPWSTIHDEPILCDALWEAIKEVLEK